jgi:hypothetical protein
MSAVEIINDNCDVLKWHQRNDEIKQESARFVRASSIPGLVAGR